MITINRAYIKVNNKKDRSIIEEMLQEAFIKLDIEWKNDIANLMVYETDSFQLQLMKLVSFNLQDLGIKASVLIVPFFNEVFTKYLDKINDGVSTAFEVFVNNINDDKTKADSKYIFEMIPKKDLDPHTIKRLHELVSTYLFNFISFLNSQIPKTHQTEFLFGSILDFHSYCLCS